jgi:AAA15 family ATPase/GTPase
MLQSYCIQGFKSIKNATEVDLKKTQYQTLEKTNVCNGILKGCMFVGANASGKTNLIEPLRFLLMALFAVREMKWKNFLQMLRMK